MSGRLIILPKKSYTPWNPQNVERVLRDERIEQEKRKRDEEALARKDRLRQIRYMKKDYSGSNRHDCDNDRGRNARKEENSGEMEMSLSTTILVPDNVGMTGVEKKGQATGILPIFLTDANCGKNRTSKNDNGKGRGGRQQDRWNIHCINLESGVGVNGQKDDINSSIDLKDERLKSKMDPMRAFTTTLPLDHNRLPGKLASKYTNEEGRQVNCDRTAVRNSLTSNAVEGTNDGTGMVSTSHDWKSYNSGRSRRLRRKKRRSDQTKYTADFESSSDSSSSSLSPHEEHTRGEEETKNEGSSIDSTRRKRFKSKHYRHRHQRQTERYKRRWEGREERKYDDIKEKNKYPKVSSSRLTPTSKIEEMMQRQQTREKEETIREDEVKARAARYRRY